MRATVISLILSRGVCGMASAQIVLSDAGEARLARFGRVLTRKVEPKTVGATQFVVGMETMPPGSVLPAHTPASRRGRSLGGENVREGALGRL
jgi:hypothetical protein